MFKNRNSLYFIPLLSQKGIFPVPKQFQQFITLFLLFPKYLYDQKSSLQYSRSHWLQSWSPENAQPAFTPHSSCILFFLRLVYLKGWVKEKQREQQKRREIFHYSLLKWPLRLRLGQAEVRNQQIHLDFPCGCQEPTCMGHILLPSQIYFQGAGLESKQAGLNHFSYLMQAWEAVS